MTNEQKAKIIELMKLGIGYRSVATAMDFIRDSVSYLCKSRGLSIYSFKLYTKLCGTNISNFKCGFVYVHTSCYFIGRDLGMVGKADSGANHCTECGLCEKYCAQNIAIGEELKNAHRELNNPILHFGMGVVKIF